MNKKREKKNFQAKRKQTSFIIFPFCHHAKMHIEYHGMDDQVETFCDGLRIGLTNQK